MTDSTPKPALNYIHDVASWLDVLPGKGKMRVDNLVYFARKAAEEFAALNMAHVELEPGDGTSYKMYLTDIERHARRSGDYNFGSKVGMILVSMPYWGGGGSSYIFALDGYHVPCYVAQKLALDEHSASVVAGFLTLFGAAVAEVRR